MTANVPFEKFRRGGGPLVSVLIPTRSRSQLLREAIGSFYDLADDKSSVEYLLKVDTDDTETIEIATYLSSILPLKTIISSRGERKYYNMHHWVNELCSLAKGDWLFVSNDDVKVKTPGWDSILLNSTLFDVDGNPITDISGRRGDIWQFFPRTNGNPEINPFCFLRRRVYEILGHYSLTPYCDDWINSVMHLSGSVGYLQVEIEHTQPSDALRKEIIEDFHANKSTIRMTSELFRAKIADVTKLLDYLDGK